MNEWVHSPQFTGPWAQFLFTGNLLLTVMTAVTPPYSDVLLSLLTPDFRLSHFFFCDADNHRFPGNNNNNNNNSRALKPQKENNL